MKIKKEQKTVNNTPKKLSFLSRGHHKRKVQMTFLISISTKLKIQMRPRRHEKKRDNLSLNPNTVQII